MRITLVFLVFTARLASQSWVQLPDFPGTERDDGVSFVINNKAYCLTGLDVGFNCRADGFVFDGASESWSPMAPLPAGNERQYAAAFSHGNAGYVLGGINCSNTCLNDFWKYDALGNSWTALANFPGIARQGMCHFKIKTKVYVAGGKLTDGSILNDLWEYDLNTANWTQKNNLPVNGMWRGAGFAIDTTGYICYGMNASGAYNHLMYAYDHTSDVWTHVPGLTFSGKRYIGTAASGNGAYLYGGQDSLGNISNDLIVFDAIDHSVHTRPGIPTFGRKGGMAFILNATFYFTTGVTNTARAKETWKATGVVGINRIGAEDGLIAYPNPVQNLLHIRGADLEKMTSLVVIYNALGEPVISLSFSEALNVSVLPPGLYVALIKARTQVHKVRFVKS